MNVTESRFKNRQLHIEDYAIDEKTCILDINGFILNTANIISGKPYTSKGVRAVWEGGDANSAKDELNLTS